MCMNDLHPMLICLYIYIYGCKYGTSPIHVCILRKSYKLGVLIAAQSLLEHPARSTSKCKPLKGTEQPARSRNTPPKYIGNSGPKGRNSKPTGSCRYIRYHVYIFV